MNQRNRLFSHDSHESEYTDAELSTMREEAAQGDAIAQHQWAVYLSTKNDEECVHWLKLAAKQGLPEALCDLGILFLEGIFVRKDEAYGVMLLKRAAEADNVIAQTCLGGCYLAGNGVKKNKKQAVLWLQAAADKGEPEALYLMSLCYSEGLGVQRDLAIANGFLMKAVELEHPLAMYEVAMNLLLGEGVQKDTAEGMKWLLRAAEADCEEAMRELSRIYAVGNVPGYPKNAQKSRFWLNKSLECDPSISDEDRSLTSEVFQMVDTLQADGTKGQLMLDQIMKDVFHR